MLTARYIEATRNIAANEVRKASEDGCTFLVLDGLPTAQSHRVQILTRVIQANIHTILFCDPAYIEDAALLPFGAKFVVQHLDERAIDKLALILGYAREVLHQERFDRSGTENRLLSLTGPTLTALTTAIRCGDNAAMLPQIGERLGALLQVRSTLSHAIDIDISDILSLFEPLIGNIPAASSSRVHRLWVEGDTDLRMFQLAAALADNNGRLLAGLELRFIGTAGRGGGTSRLAETIAREQTSPEWDLFLFDNDSSGRAAGELVSKLGQRSLILPQPLATNSWLGDFEIEDLVSVDCLDRFYESETDLLPEAEYLVYGNAERRRLVVRGIDKERFVTWMKSNASSDDVQNIIRLLKYIRSLHGLAYGEEIPKDFTATILNHSCRFGRRPKPWWYASTAER